MASRDIFVSFILLLIYITGSSAEDTVYVQTGASVHLDIQRDQLPAEIEELFWQNGKADTIVKYYDEFKKVKDYDDFKNRVEFNNKTFSLTLKNMQKNDSGDYTAKINGKSNRDITVRVSVIDAVKAPVLTVMYEWSSSDFCTVNFTCRGHNLTLNSSYNNGSCSPEEVTSHEKHTLTLICSEESIICNHSNPVSSKTDKRDIKQLCEISENPEKHEDSRNHLWVIYLVTGCVFGCIALILAGFCICKRNKESPLTSNENGGQQVNTVYEGVNGSQLLETITTEPHTCDFPDNTQEKNKDNETSTIYHLVGQPANPPVAATDHTIYSTVCKVKKPDAN